MVVFHSCHGQSNPNESHKEKCGYHLKSDLCWPTEIRSDFKPAVNSNTHLLKSCADAADHTSCGQPHEWFSVRTDAQQLTVKVYKYPHLVDVRCPKLKDRQTYWGNPAETSSRLSHGESFGWRPDLWLSRLCSLRKCGPSTLESPGITWNYMEEQLRKKVNPSDVF